MHAIDPSIKRGITPAIHRATPRAIHPARVVLHWLLAAMLLFMMGMGGLVLQHMPNTAPAKLGALQGHMIGGAAILALMLVRWIVVVHVAAALYHQWICRQGALQRMGLRRRRPGEAA